LIIHPKTERSCLLDDIETDADVYALHVKII